MGKIDQGGEDREWWLNPEIDPPQKVKTGGYVKATVGKLKPEHVNPMYMEDYKNQPGVDANLVKDENGQNVVEISVNKVVLPDNKIPKQKRKPFKWPGDT